MRLYRISLYDDDDFKYYLVHRTEINYLALFLKLDLILLVLVCCVSL